MQNDRAYHIRQVLEGETLGAGLRILNPKLSWTEAKKLIHQRHVQVNGNLVLDDTRRLKTGDVVKVFGTARAPVPTDKDVRVLHVDEDLIVIDKPAGITTLRHAEEQSWDDRRKQRQPTLDEVVQRLLPGVLAANRAGGTKPSAKPVPPKPGPAAPAGVFRRPGGKPSASPPAGVPKVRPVHRLDRDTSGLMLFALSHRAEPKLVQMFKDHTIRRVYRAVVVGNVAEPMRLESWFIRDRGDGLRGSSPMGQEAAESQHAITHVRPIESIAGGQYTIIECRLETGRTHQIRIHLAEAGHMLCGEKTYIRPKPAEKAILDESGASRQALHSAELELTHPITGEAMKFTTPMPKEMAQWLEGLKKVRNPNDE